MDDIVFPLLYKKTKLNQVQKWQIFVKDNYYYTEEGINILTKSQPTYCFGKNKGKKNETSDYQQAILEAQSKYKKKIDSGYSTTLTNNSSFFSPMLAFEFEKYKHLCFTVPTFIQPKLDGIRCYLNNAQLTTRTGKSIISCKHLELSYYGLDGELYNHSLKDNFNEIISLVRKTNLTNLDLEKSKNNIEFWIYDYPLYSNLVFSDRFKKLKELSLPDGFKLVPTYQIENETELNVYHNNFIENGYEGSIIRLDIGGYENSRSKQLLKLKNWKEEDFEIVDILEGRGNRKGCANIITIKINSDILCNITVTGTEDYMKQVWEERNKIIGKLASVKFFNYTPDNLLRFPTLKAIRDYE